MEHGLTNVSDADTSEAVAEIEQTVGFAQGYGEIKVSATVRCRCPQNDKDIREVGKAVHLLAYELAIEGFNMVCADMKATR